MSGINFSQDIESLDSLAKESQWAEQFYFVQAADCQFGLIDRYFKELETPGWNEELELSRKLVDSLNKMQPKPKFMVICGDLADAYPDTPLREPQIVDFKKVYGELDPQIKLVCVCGNHDLGDEPTLATIEKYKQDFGVQDYFFFVLDGVLFIIINSQFYKHRSHLVDYAKRHDDWLDRVLTKCKLFKYSIVFEHIPWFLSSHDEPSDYFNIDPQIRLVWLEKFRKAGVSKIMCGHYHQNAGGWYHELEQVVTSAIGAVFGEDPSGVRFVKLLDKTIEHKYVTIEDLTRIYDRISSEMSDD